MSEKKPFKSYRTQLRNLRDRGMYVPTNGTPMRILEKENYYNVINGYKDLFLQTRKTAISSETYKTGTKFSEINALYNFDCELKAIFLKRLLRIENHIKSAIAYHFSAAYGAKNYLIIENFDLNPRSYETAGTRYSDVMRLIVGIQGDIARQIKKHESINHYMLEYGYVPLWVLMNILTFGTVSYFYKFMKQPDKQKISKLYKISENEFELMLKILSLVRNICAHDERLYNFRSRDNIKENWVHKTLALPKGPSGYINGRNDLFAVLICIRIFLKKSEFKKMTMEIKKALKDLEKELNVISINDILNRMGFPINWENIMNV